MTDASSKTGGKANGAEPSATTVSTRSAVSRGAITPALALARHVEWLDFALAAARSEETWRAARLKKATKKTLDKRTSRLAEVRDEIASIGRRRGQATRCGCCQAARNRRAQANGSGPEGVGVGGGRIDDGHASDDRAEAIDDGKAGRVQAGGDEEAGRDSEKAVRIDDDTAGTTTRRTAGRPSGVTAGRHRHSA